MVHTLFLSWYVRDRARTIFAVDLAGACAMASWVLCEILRELNESPVFCYSEEGHAWVEWNGWVLDPTHTQFKRRSRKLRYLKIGSLRWRKDIYTDRLEGAKALTECNYAMDGCSPRQHRRRLRTMVRSVVQEVRHELHKTRLRWTQ